MKPLYTKEQFENSKSTDKLPCECRECKNVFYRTKHNIKDSLNVNLKTTIDFCGKICYGISQRTKEKYFCKQCNKEVLKKPSQIKKSKSGNVFCSHSCSCTYKNMHKTTGSCRSKLEIWLELKLTTLYPNLQILFNDKTIINSELDIYFPSLKLAFELNGIFHYEPIFGKEKLNKAKNNDQRKFQACIEHGIELCIIDTSAQKYVKDSTSQKYLDIIKNIISKKDSTFQ